jgi:hypothetical protein
MHSFDYASHYVPAITMKSGRGIEFLLVNMPKLAPGDEAEAERIRSYLSSFVSCAVVLASRQASGEWLLFGDPQFVSACHRDALDCANWVEHALHRNRSSA